MSGFIPLQKGLMPSRGPAFNMGQGDRDKYQRYSASGMPSRWGQYQMTTRPMPNTPNQITSANTPTGVTPADMPGRGSYQNSPFGGGQGLPSQDDAMRWANQRQRGPVGNLREQQQLAWAGTPQTGGGLTVEGGPGAYREPQLPIYRPPASNQATGLLSEPPRTRREQVQNMQGKIAEYQAGAGTNPEFDQNQLNKMQGRLNYVSRMRRQGR